MKCKTRALLKQQELSLIALSLDTGNTTGSTVFPRSFVKFNISSVPMHSALRKLTFRQIAYPYSAAKLASSGLGAFGLATVLCGTTARLEFRTMASLCEHDRVTAAARHFAARATTDNAFCKKFVLPVPSYPLLEKERLESTAVLSSQTASREPCS